MKSFVGTIEALRICKSYNEFDALTDVSFSVESGDFFGLFGPNGAGKTSLLRILSGQLKPTSGGAKVLGIDVVRHPLKVKERVGIVPEVESPPSYLTASEYLYFVGKVRKVEDIESKVAKWMSFFELQDSAHTLCKDLSKGMRQKVMLVSAMIHEPRVLFLDEPFINLDPIHQKKLKEYLLDYVSGGNTIFLCSHLLDIAERLCNKVAVIDRGRIVAAGTLDVVRGDDDDLESAFLRLVGR